MAASIGFNADNQFTVGGTALDYGRNYIINGGFDYWNYATSQTSSGYGSDDRWNNVNLGSTKTHYLVSATDTERALFNSSKFSRTVVTSVAGAGNQTLKYQAIENVTKLAGKTITISFWAKADTTKNIAVEIAQLFGSGGTPSTLVTGIGAQLVALTSSWQKKTITVTIPSIVGKTLGTDGVHTSMTSLHFWFDAGSTFSSRTASLGQQSGTFDIAEVKLEVGTVYTPWTPYEGEFGGELQACQRYLPIADTSIYNCQCASSVSAYAVVPFKVDARVAPTGATLLGIIGNSVLINSIGSAIALTSISFNSGGKASSSLAIGVGSGLVAGNASILFMASNKILFTGCEL